MKSGSAVIKEVLMPERVTQERRAQRGTSAPMNSIAEKRAGPGLLLMSASMQLIYCDPCARQLWLLLNKEVSGKMAYGVLPPDITNFCHEVIELLGRPKVRQGLGRVSAQACDWHAHTADPVTGNRHALHSRALGKHSGHYGRGRPSAHRSDRRGQVSVRSDRSRDVCHPASRERRN